MNVMSWSNTDPDAEYRQMCVWPATIVRDEDVDGGELQSFFKENFNLEHPIKIVGCVITEPNEEHKNMEEPPTGGRTDFVFFVHGADIAAFSLPRLQYGIRWWEDVVGNKSHNIYPQEFIEYGKRVYCWEGDPWGDDE